jgi:hypothetical protein
VCRSCNELVDHQMPEALGNEQLPRARGRTPVGCVEDHPMLPRRLSAVLLAVSMLVPFAARATVATRATTAKYAVHLLPGAGGEPNVSISPSGRYVLADGLGNDAPATLYRSTDYGRTFRKITPSFPNTGGGDWDMRWLDDKHVIAADLTIGSGIYVDRSADAGLHWQQTRVLEDVYDRPWLDHFGMKKVYLVTKGFDGIPYLYQSIDGGVTFNTAPLPIPLPTPIYGTGTTPAALGGTSPNAAEMAYGGLNAYVDHLVVDQHTGDVYVLYGLSAENTFSRTAPLGNSSRLYVAHLENGAMVSHLVYSGPADAECLGGFNWLAVDQARNVYTLANCRTGGRWSTRLSYSKNHGKTWSKLIDVGPAGAANVYGSIAGGSTGLLSLVYLRGSKTDPSQPQNWYVEMERIAGANTSRPSIARVRPIAKPIHTKDICFDGIACGLPGFGKNRDLLDYIWNAIDSSGNAYAVIASDGAASGTAKGVSVIVLRQTSGPSLGRGVQS